jgi:trehalose synthase
MSAPSHDAGSLTAVTVGTASLDRFGEILSGEQFEDIRAQIADARRTLADRAVWNVNSTARGGGVAEMLVSLLAYARGEGIDARWHVIGGDEEFFTITKRIHNRLHGFAGDGGPLGQEQRAHYEATLESPAATLGAEVRRGDVVILHDPQTAGLIPAIRALGVPVIWRCHIGVDTPNDLARETWHFLEPYVAQADATVFSRAAFAWDPVPPERRVVIPPSIDAFAPKNQEIDAAGVEAILAASGVRQGDASGARPAFRRMDGDAGEVRRRAEMIEDQPLRARDAYVLQVSRWDALKDPLGVIGGFAEHVAPYSDAHLVYAGPAVQAVADDPEGATVLESARALWSGLAPEVRSRIHLALLPMDDPQENAAVVNAMQRAAVVVVQKSLAEGFGLTVTEAMWKARPIVASRIGGIREQIEDGRSGVLLDEPSNLPEYGAAIVDLLEDPARAAEMGLAGKATVADRFLGLHSILAYFVLLERLLR